MRKSRSAPLPPDLEVQLALNLRLSGFVVRTSAEMFLGINIIWVRSGMLSDAVVIEVSRASL